MDFFKPTHTISVNPPGGTHTDGHHHHGHHDPLPAPTHTPIEAVTRYIHASNAGHTALWVVFVMFTVAFLGVYILSKRVERRFRLFHWICGTILGIAMVSYLCMATGLGISYVSTHNPNGHHNSNVLLKREVYWARYVDWLLTTPLLLLDLSLLAGLSPATTVSIIVVDVFMILTGLFSGLMPAAFNDGARARWLFYAISCIAFLVILYTLVVNGRQAAKLQSASVQKVYATTSLLTIVLWTAYPIVFALTEGANRISVDAEVIAYAVLDVTAKIVFSYLLIFMHSHSEADTVAIPERWVEARGSRGGYGAVASDD